MQRMTGKGVSERGSGRMQIWGMAETEFAPGDTELSSDVFGGDAHGEHTRLSLLDHFDSRVDPALPCHRVGRHGLDATGQPDGVVARFDRCCYAGDGL